MSKEFQEDIEKEKPKKKRGPKPVPKKLKSFDIDRRSNRSLLNRHLLTNNERKQLRSRPGICPNCGEHRSNKKYRIYLDKYNPSYRKTSFIESCIICHEDLSKRIEILHKNGGKFELSELRKMIKDESIRYITSLENRYESTYNNSNIESLPGSGYKYLCFVL